MSALKLTAIGTSTGLVIPKELLTRLRVAKGDTLFAVETPNGLLLSTLNPDVAAQVELGRKVMKQYRETMTRLAK